MLSKANASTHTKIGLKINQKPKEDEKEVVTTIDMSAIEGLYKLQVVNLDLKFQNVNILDDLLILTMSSK